MTLRDQLLTGLTHLKEIEATAFDQRIILRELTAEQRITALQAGVASDGLLYAIVLQQSARDPETGALLFTPADVGALSDGNSELKRLGDLAWSLSEATADSLKSGDQDADTGQPDPAARAEVGEADA